MADFNLFSTLLILLLATNLLVSIALLIVLLPILSFIWKLNKTFDRSKQTFMRAGDIMKVLKQTVIYKFVDSLGNSRRQSRSERERVKDDIE